LSPTLHKAASLSKKRDLQYYLAEEKNIRCIKKPVGTNSQSVNTNKKISIPTITRTLVPNVPKPGVEETNPFEYRVFAHPFVLIEDNDLRYSSVYKEYEADIKGITYPVFYWNSQPGHCPFVLPNNPVFPVNRPLPSTPGPTVTAPFKNTTSKLGMTTRSKTLKKSPIAGRIVIKKQVYSVTSNKPRPGFCECCWDRYSDLDQHILEADHRSYALDPRNYRELDCFLLDHERPPLHPPCVTRSPVSPAKSLSASQSKENLLASPFNVCPVGRNYTEPKNKRQSVQALFEREASLDSPSLADVFSSPSVKRQRRNSELIDQGKNLIKKRLFV
jgi:hypothetical protein